MPAALAPQPEVIKSAPDEDCRVYERHGSDLLIQCQPLAARGDNDIMWPASVRNISEGGIGLVLKRRFEPRTGLQIHLPDPGSDSTYTVFVRVVHLQQEAEGRWLLGCEFISPLTEERLNSLLELKRAAEAAPPPKPAPQPEPAVSSASVEKAVIMGVLFQVRYGNTARIRRRVTRLYVTGAWPLPTGKPMRVWAGSGPIDETVANIRVNGCYHQEGGWLIDCYFLGLPPTSLLEKLIRS